MSPEEQAAQFESAALVDSIANLMSKVAMPGAGVTEAAVAEEGTPLIDFLEGAGIDYHKAVNGGSSFIDQTGRVLGAETLVTPGSIVTTATNRDNGS